MKLKPLKAVTSKGGNLLSEDLLVTLGVKDKGARAQITALNKEIKYLDKEFKTATNSSKTY